jgi:quercetin dioxygenase-like cupin family protein
MVVEYSASSFPFQKEPFMKRIHVLAAVASIAALGLAGFAVQSLRAQEPLKAGTVLEKTNVAGGQEAMLVLRTVPAGGESGFHTSTGGEIVYVLEGSVILEVRGKTPLTVKQGAAFETKAGEVHNVKNASATAPCKALAFYVAKPGTPMEELSVPVK